MSMDNRLMVQRRNYDADALRYLNAVQLADGQALEPEVSMAVDAFVRGCKADGIWDAIKASCILCGARTLSGALVPLVGTAPTAQGGWASGDYVRSTGMKGDGNSLYLDTNRASNADGQDDRHRAVYISAIPTATACYLGAYQPGEWIDDIFHSSNTAIRPSMWGAPIVSYPNSTGFAAYSRVPGSIVTTRVFGNQSSTASTSATPTEYSPLVFSRREGAVVQAGVYTDASLSFYSLGSSLDITALDNRVSALVSAIGTALS